MIETKKSWLENTTVYRMTFFLIAPMVIYIEKYLYKEEILALNYILLILSALAFRKLWMLIISSGAVTLLIHYHSLGSSNDYISSILFHWLSFLAVSYLITTFIEKLINENQYISNLTILLAKTIDLRDNYTAFHSQNVAYYSKEIARELKLSESVCEDIYIGGLLHDIGKIGVPENILNKPSKLTTDEFNIIKRHPVLGHGMVQHINSFKKKGISDMILYHHERYDGNGYPQGLKGVEIPLAARILAVADAFDAMTSRRIYRDAMEIGYILSEIQNNRGKQFDPKIVDAFLKVAYRDGKIDTIKPKSLPFKIK